jgi:hypothetical protein
VQISVAIAPGLRYRRRVSFIGAYLTLSRSMRDTIVSESYGGGLEVSKSVESEEKLINALSIVSNASSPLQHHMNTHHALV